MFQEMCSKSLVSSYCQPFHKYLTIPLQGQLNILQNSISLTILSNHSWKLSRHGSMLVLRERCVQPSQLHIPYRRHRGSRRAGRVQLRLRDLLPWPDKRSLLNNFYCNHFQQWIRYFAGAFNVRYSFQVKVLEVFRLVPMETVFIRNGVYRVVQ